MPISSSEVNIENCLTGMPYTKMAQQGQGTIDTGKLEMDKATKRVGGEVLLFGRKKVGSLGTVKKHYNELDFRMWKG